MAPELSHLSWAGAPISNSGTKGHVFTFHSSWFTTLPPVATLPAMARPLRLHSSKNGWNEKGNLFTFHMSFGGDKEAMIGSVENVKSEDATPCVLKEVYYGFEAAAGSESSVGPDQVSPPYKLQAIGAYSCYSALQIRGNTGDDYFWRSLVSANGTVVGYTASVWWGNVWWNEEAVNSGIIPP
jgi:hypothetical protein